MLSGIRSALRRVETAIRCRLSFEPTPAEVVDVVKNNTREAFEYFWQQEHYIKNEYLDPSRLELYDIVAARCAALLSDYNSVPTIRVVDIGCGSGHMLQSLQSKLRNRKLELFGLDYAASAVTATRRLLPSAPVIVGDIFDNCFRSDYFDIVLSIETFEHLGQPDEALVQTVRLAKPGGTLLFTVPNGEKDDWEGHRNFWTQPQFEQFLSRQGFATCELIQSDTIILAQLTKAAVKPS